MAKKKGLSTARKIIVIGVVLVVIQVGLLVFFRQKRPVAFNDAVNIAVDRKKGLTDRRKAQLKIQLALSDYRNKNGQYPESLSDLSPDYFNVVPVDPTTQKPFDYSIDNGKYLLGAVVKTIIAQNPNVEAALAADKDLLASLSNVKPEDFIYDSTNKRDPFRSFNLTPTKEIKGSTPLERYEVGQLKLTVVLDGFDEPYAMVENDVGRGFKVTKGTKIGTNGGEVIEIRRDRILILETATDFTGKKKSRTIEMKLRTQENTR